jgi:glycosyltransferase involved in cell wall biosynthesis
MAFLKLSDLKHIKKDQINKDFLEKPPELTFESEEEFQKLKKKGATIMKLQLRDIEKMKRWGKYDVNKSWEYLSNQGILNGYSHVSNLDWVVDCFKNEPLFIIGASAGLKQVKDWSFLKNFHTIGINHVIEDYEEYIDWLIFLDQRFLDRTTYDINRFKGKIFCNVNIGLSGDNVFKFKPLPQGYQPNVQLNANLGLYSGSLSGHCALHLALITGANPIYLLGMDAGGGDAQAYHYKDDYTGEVKGQKKLDKYESAALLMEKFTPFSDNRVFNVDTYAKIPFFKRISWDDIPFDKLPAKSIDTTIVDTKVICHVSPLPSVDVLGDISRYIYERCEGKHIYSTFDSVPDNADVYILHCFINSYDKFVNFQKPNKKCKVISIVHSSGRCYPALCSDRVINLTNHYQKFFSSKGVRSVVIPGCVDLSLYKDLPDYTKKTFGRITKNSVGKVHPEWKTVVENILTKVPESTCTMITDNPKKQAYVDHPNMKYITDIKINELDKKVRALQSYSIFVDMHNTFQETFSLCMLEAMAAGQAIVLLDNQPAMKEVAGDAAIYCSSVKEVEQKVIELLNDPKLKKEWGLKARKRAAEFSVENMIKQYNKIIEELI